MNKKTVLITGANRGIGLATARKFLEEGYHVFFGTRSIRNGRQALIDLPNKENITLIELDIADKESIEIAVQEILLSTNHIDVLINNAAINYDTWHNALTADLDEVEQTIHTNLMGAWRLSQKIIPIMEKNNYGRVINISSGAGALSSMNGSTPGYNISKLALNGLTLSLSNLVSESIKVNSVCPGWVRTDMGGSDASRAPEEAANDIYLLSQNSTTSGKFLRYNEIIDY